jgi:ribosomal protein S18 acetylase RimI-like enzyme
MKYVQQYILKDGRTVEIKVLTREDYEKNSNYEFVHEWLNEVNKYLNYEFDRENVERDKKDFFENYLQSKNEILVGALYDGKIIASSSLRLNLKINKRKHVGEWGIAIHPDFHNQGLGMRLLTIIEDIAKEKGLKRLEADFYSGNLSAEHLYVKKMNYKVEGKRKLAALLKDGTYTDKIMIGKIINKELEGDLSNS